MINHDRFFLELLSFILHPCVDLTSNTFHRLNTLVHLLSHCFRISMIPAPTFVRG
jgi:hypothetical protein